ncbi:hypothetical protein [Candidatus Deferrimicrobium sp.]|uniref:hypothetical protein n=1 Tax=Candidatus Deferrimicrobium sp. TaxID=3060586 RepID=UPI00271D13DB|nr:hypothetical protein [Candidatus Deferrimicrobium sp.]MDO8738326.1 hypothetical protein [Candidatus Deferrimicrobium sp.]
MNAEELARDRANHPDRYAKKQIRFTYRPMGPGRWEETDEEGNHVGVVTELPFNARPVQQDDPDEAEYRRHEQSVNAYERRRLDPAFEETRVRMRMFAATLPDAEADALDRDHRKFNETFDSLKLSDLEEQHKVRLAAIKERQYSHNAATRDAADDEIIDALDGYHAEQARIKSGRYEDI